MAQVVDRRSGRTSVAEMAEPNLTGPEPVAEPQQPPAEAALTAEQVRGQAWRLVQNLADILSDEVVRFVRQRLADEDAEGAVSAIVFACVRQGTTISTVEYAVLAECLIGVGGDPGVLDYIVVGDVDRPVLFDFVPLPRDAADVLGGLPAPDGAAPDDRQDEVLAAVRALDESVALRLGSPDGVLGVWRGWRYPVTGSAWPRPVPVYLVEAADDEAAADVAAAYYGTTPGPDPDPIVEVYPGGAELPPMHRALQFGGELVIAATSAAGFTFADVFDSEPDEAGRPTDIVHLSEDEADRIVGYLLSGTPMLVADTQGTDVLDPDRGQGVPLHLRTDGTWIWSDASAYYAREHLVAPPAEFYAYLQSVPQTAGRVSDVTLHQAVVWLQSS